MDDGRGRGKAGRCEDEGRYQGSMADDPTSVKVAYGVQKDDMACRIRWYRQSSCISQSQLLEMEIVQRQEGTSRSINHQRGKSG
jgi:hypothetical protein